MRDLYDQTLSQYYINPEQEAYRKEYEELLKEEAELKEKNRQFDENPEMVLEDEDEYNVMKKILDSYKSKLMSKVNVGSKFT